MRVITDRDRQRFVQRLTAAINEEMEAFIRDSVRFWAKEAKDVGVPLKAAYREAITASHCDIDDATLDTLIAEGQETPKQRRARERMEETS
jgi:hypothetical protein